MKFVTLFLLTVSVLAQVRVTVEAQDATSFKAAFGRGIKGATLYNVVICEAGGKFSAIDEGAVLQAISPRIGGRYRLLSEKVLQTSRSASRRYIAARGVEYISWGAASLLLGGVIQASGAEKVIPAIIGPLADKLSGEFAKTQVSLDDAYRALLTTGRQVPLAPGLCVDRITLGNSIPDTQFEVLVQ